MRGVSGGQRVPVLPAKFKGGHWSADKRSQASVFNVLSIDRGFGMLQEPFVVREHFGSIYSCAFPGV